MTEDEAKTKWCPFARMVDPNANPPEPVCNRWAPAEIDNAVIPQAALCIASDCMVWRKQGLRGQGYCGLAGKPQ